MQHALHKHDVLPTLELETHLALDTDEVKAVARMETQRGRIASSDPGHNGMYGKHARVRGLAES